MKKNNWVYKVFLWTFILSTIFSFSTNYLSSHASIVVTYNITRYSNWYNL